MGKSISCLLQVCLPSVNSLSLLFFKVVVYDSCNLFPSLVHQLLPLWSSTLVVLPVEEFSPGQLPIPTPFQISSVCFCVFAGYD